MIKCLTMLNSDINCLINTVQPIFKYFLQALLKWIEGVELLIESESFLVNSSDIMEEQLTQYKVMKYILTCTDRKEREKKVHYKCLRLTVGMLSPIRNSRWIYRIISPV